MKKTLTTITLSGIAIAAIANPADSAKNIPAPIANVNINLPTGGAKPLAKIESSNSTSAVTSDTVKNHKVKTTDDLAILPLPLPMNTSEGTNILDNKSNEKILSPKDVKTEVTLEKKESINKVVDVKKDKEKSEIVIKKDTSSTEVKDVLPKSNIKKEIKPNKINSKSTDNLTVNNSGIDKPNVSSSKKSEVKEEKHNLKENINNNKSQDLPSKNKSFDKSSSNLSEKNTQKDIKGNPVKDIKKNETQSTTDSLNKVDNKRDELKQKSESKDKEVVNASKQDSENKVNNTKLVNNKDKKTTTKDIKKKNNPKKPISQPEKKSITPMQQISPVSKEITFIKPEKEYVISSNDVIVDVLYNSTSKEYLVKFNHNLGEQFRHSDYSNIFNVDGDKHADTPILLNWTNSKLDKMKIIKSEVNPQGEYLIKVPESEGKCEAFYVTYKFRNDKSSFTKSIILDSNGQPTASIDRDCAIPKVKLKEDINMTKNGYFVTTSWKDPVPSIKKPITFSSIISKDGEALLPSQLDYLIFSEDLSNFYYSIGKKNGHSILGYSFIQPINKSGIYFFTSNFSLDGEKSDFATSKKFISE